jgi:hypothetical protein
MEAVFTAGLHDGGAEIVRITQHHHRDARGGLELPQQLGGQCGGRAEGQPSGRTVCVFDREPDANRDDVITADQDGTDILVAPDVRVGRGVLHLGDGVYGSTPFGFLRIIQDQLDGLSRLGTAGAQSCLGLLAECRFRIPPLNQEEVVDAGPVVRSVQIPLQVGDIPPPPQKGHGADHQAKGDEMLPVNMPLQGLKNLVKAGGHAYDAEHGVILLTPPACGRWVRS